MLSPAAYNGRIQVAGLLPSDDKDQGVSVRSAEFGITSEHTDQVKSVDWLRRGAVHKDNGGARASGYQGEDAIAWWDVMDHVLRLGFRAPRYPLLDFALNRGCDLIRGAFDRANRRSSASAPGQRPNAQRRVRPSVSARLKPPTLVATDPRFDCGASCSRSISPLSPLDLSVTEFKIYKP